MSFGRAAQWDARNPGGVFYLFICYLFIFIYLLLFSLAFKSGVCLPWLLGENGGTNRDIRGWNERRMDKGCTPSAGVFGDRSTIKKKEQLGRMEKLREITSGTEELLWQRWMGTNRVAACRLIALQRYKMQDTVFTLWYRLSYKYRE